MERSTTEKERARNLEKSKARTGRTAVTLNAKNHEQTIWKTIWTEVTDRQWKSWG